MSLFDFDTATFADNNIPPDKRLPKILTFAKALLSVLQTSSTYFTIYRNGDVYLPWDVTTAYLTGDITYYQGRNYEALQDHTGRPPFDTDYWILQNPSSLGSEERVRYQPNKLILEYALNRFFGTEFRQPPLQSDIYITNAAYFNPSFLVGGIEEGSSQIALDSSTGYVVNDYFVQFPYSFEINIPTAAYTAAGGNDASILNFANKITAAGKTPIVTTY